MEYISLGVHIVSYDEGGKPSISMAMEYYATSNGIYPDLLEGW
jgi:hypothetical protein